MQYFTNINLNKYPVFKLNWKINLISGKPLFNISHFFLFFRFSSALYTLKSRILLPVMLVLVLFSYNGFTLCHNWMVTFTKLCNFSHKSLCLSCNAITQRKTHSWSFVIEHGPVHWEISLSLSLLGWCQVQHFISMMAVGSAVQMLSNLWVQVFTSNVWS